VTPPTRETLGVGRSTLGLPQLGFGAAALGNLFTALDDDTARAAVDAAWDAGVRHFDVAPHYGLGLAERRLGSALAERPRDDYVLSTKVGRILRPSPETAGDRDDMGFDVPADVKRPTVSTSSTCTTPRSTGWPSRWRPRSRRSPPCGRRGSCEPWGSAPSRSTPSARPSRRA
jgi:hypothetical protein